MRRRCRAISWRAGVVPRDSFFVMTGTPYVAQVFPIGANALAQPAQPVTEGAAGAENEEAVAVVEEEVTETVIPPKETVAGGPPQASSSWTARRARPCRSRWSGSASTIPGSTAPSGPERAQTACRSWQTIAALSPRGFLDTAPAGTVLPEEYRGRTGRAGDGKPCGRRAGNRHIDELSLPLAMVEFERINKLSLRSICADVRPNQRRAGPR